ncbi:AMP-binding protein [Labilibaculum sp. A4]|uniref:AMP-binding protein n=1 Tax=Labilibaculum euxinus TaxID=2686357 RepID=UPI000F626B4B|nr:AMP-binding protein [Labilibaculum euxinus]MDQ1772673.1 AMP-binding protein [Labilibaculum euxinus]MWN76749.1 AMP-binding protein [Labilibaculum euxinus]
MNKLSYEHGSSNLPLLGETIIERLRKTVELFGDRDALIVPYQNYKATYLEFWQQIEEVAKGLLAFGVGKGDRVGIWSPNRHEWVIVQFATARIGAILVNVNPAYKSAELKFALRQSEISLLIMSEGFRKTNYFEIIQEVRQSCIHLKQIVILDRDWHALIEAGKRISTSQIEEIESQLQFDDPINIQYTSGTTGFPKGATLTHHNILNNGYFIGERLHYNETDRVCIPVPFYHCFGMVLGNLACITHGSAMVIPGEAFEAETVLKTVQDEKCTSLYGVPLMFIAELEHPNFEKYDLSSLRTGIMAGASCPEKAMLEVQEKMNMKEVAICYGMTETSPVSTQTFVNDELSKRVGTVGRVHPHQEIKIIDPETGKIVARGEGGEFCTRGYSVMLKYWNNEEATKSVIDNAGWMHTGDLASMDEDGYVTITGRIKDLIIRGGENISPFEIEEFFHSHESISEVYVIGVPDYKYGEVVMAWIKFKEGKSATEEELRDYCKGQIATYKIPKYFKFTSEFPTTVTGKIRKVEMRDISSKELELIGR